MGIPNEEFFVAMKNILQKYAYTWIFEPTVDLAVTSSVAISNSIKSLDPFWFGSVEATSNSIKY